MSEIIIKPQPDYELIDSGDEMKLERYGDVVLVRPDPQALWPKKLEEKVWQKADATFVKGGHDKKHDSGDTKSENGKWNISSQFKSKFKDADSLNWPIALGSIKLYARLTPFKHTGIFPEQLSNWQWCEEIIKKNTDSTAGKKPKVLNLFGYSGGASIACAAAGAEVTHVDASRAAITWAKENMLLTGLGEDSIRWILEDAVQFIKKEIRRGNTYDAILMDPPVFGRGAKGEVWKIERDLLPLLEMCYQLLSKEPLFFILNGYASGYSAVSYANNLAFLSAKYGGAVEYGELLIEESGSTNRYLPCGIVARWKS